MKRDLGAEDKAADAQTAFVITAWSALSPKARRQLFSRRAEEVPRWVKRWRVNASCMVEYARELRALAANSPKGDALGRDLWRRVIGVDRRVPVPPRPEWLSELKRLDKLPFWMRVGVSDKVAASHLEEYRSRALVDDEDMLAPVAADPLRETKKHFMDRAEDHYRSRRLRLRRIADAGKFTIAPPKLSPKLHERVNWLVRFQIRDESSAAIAKSSGLLGAGGQITVKKAIQDVAALIGLPLRPERRGRPRTKPAADLVEARTFRAVLTRRFQKARDESPGAFLFKLDIKNAIDETFSDWSLQHRQKLLSQITTGGIKPSSAAARISAQKFGLPLRSVRAGRATQVPRRRAVVRFQEFEKAERRSADMRKGHHPRR